MTWIANVARASLLAAAVLAGCASHGPAPSGRPINVPVPAGNPPGLLQSPGQAPLPAAEESVPGVRLGANRSEVQSAYPTADCSSGQCLGSVALYGMPASFLVFAQPDGRWIANVAVTDATPAAKAFANASGVLRGRYAQAPESEQGGNLLRWKLDAAGSRQVVLRRCTPEQKCRGGTRTVVELDFFVKGQPGQLW